jgi:iron-sulfur cluster repair protein YtfE (RIC family)
MTDFITQSACDFRPGLRASRPLDITWTVDAVLRALPGTAAVFNAFGIDTCCGGGATLDEAARGACLEPDALLDMLNRSRDSLAPGGR